MTFIIILKEKHSTRYISAAKGINHAARAIVIERVNEGFWYSGADLDKACAIAGGRASADAAWAFLVKRSKHEYEGVERVLIEELGE